MALEKFILSGKPVAPQTRRFGASPQTGRIRSPRNLPPLKNGSLKPSSPFLMGILNLTPDSFFDGGRFQRADAALRRAEQMVQEGADLLDLGGESTRPGAEPVPAELEWSRVGPTLQALQRHLPGIPISIDTQKAEVARRALEEGADWINDVSGLSADPGMIEVVLRARPRVVLMHLRGTPRTMQTLARYRDVTQEVKRELAARVRALLRRGFPKSKIFVDPGIGFAKTAEQNLTLLRELPRFHALGCPILLGCSRKSFLGTVLGRALDPAVQGGSGTALPPSERLEGSLACALWGALAGVAVLRVHDVGPTRRALRVLEAILSGEGERR